MSKKKEKETTKCVSRKYNNDLNGSVDKTDKPQPCHRQVATDTIKNEKPSKILLPLKPVFKPLPYVPRAIA